MRRAAAAALAVVLAGIPGLSLAGCAAPAPAAVVAIALPSDEGRWADVAGVLRARLGDAGYTVDLRVAGDDIPAQVRQVGELLARDPRALIVAPVDATSLTPELDRAEPGIEIVSLGTLVRDTGAIDRYVGFDAAVEGYLQALALLQGLGLVDDAGTPVAGPPAGPFGLELVAGSPDDPRAEPAFAGAMSVLTPWIDDGTLVVRSGETSLTEVSTLRGDGEVAATRMRAVLAASYPGGVPDAVLTPSDEIARAVAGVLLDAGAVAGDRFPVLSGRGTELRSLAALSDGRQYATLLEDPRLLAAEAADRVVETLAGSGLPGATGLPPLPDPSAPSDGAAVDNGARLVPASLLQPVPVRAQDVDAVVVGSGYWTRERVDAAIAEFGLPTGPTPGASPTPGS